MATLTSHDIAVYSYDWGGMSDSFLEKLGKKIIKPIRGVVRPVGAAAGGALTLGLIKPKVLHVTSDTGKKIYKTAGTVGKVAAGATAIYFAAPIVGPALKTVGSSLLGFFKGSGLGDAAAQAATNAVLAGRQPIPSGLTTDPSFMSQASMFTGLGSNTMLLAGGLLVGGIILYSISRRISDAKKRR